MTPSFLELAARTAKRAGISPSTRAPKRRGTSARILGFSPALRRRLGRPIIVFGRPLSLLPPDFKARNHSSRGNPYGLKSHSLSPPFASSMSRKEKPRCRFDQPSLEILPKVKTR